MPIAPLPYIDEHETVIEAPAETIWRALSETLDHSSRATTASRRTP
ncbi:hypothetical protein ACIQZN_24965 [Streptomyces sp. NPDC097595]